jgi:hypothetical protein
MDYHDYESSNRRQQTIEDCLKQVEIKNEETRLRK